MIVRNNGKRVLILNQGVEKRVKGQDGEFYSLTEAVPHIVPPGGETVEVPDDLRETEFVMNLMLTGELVEVPQTPAPAKRGRKPSEQAEE